jgi:hypothetical protein
MLFYRAEAPIPQKPNDPGVSAGRSESLLESSFVSLSEPLGGALCGGGRILFRNGPSSVRGARSRPGLGASGLHRAGAMIASVPQETSRAARLEALLLLRREDPGEQECQVSPLCFVFSR